MRTIDGRGRRGIGGDVYVGWMRPAARTWWWVPNVTAGYLSYRQCTHPRLSTLYMTTLRSVALSSYKSRSTATQERIVVDLPSLQPQIYLRCGTFRASSVHRIRLANFALCAWSACHSASQAICQHRGVTASEYGSSLELPPIPGAR